MGKTLLLYPLQQTQTFVLDFPNAQNVAQIVYSHTNKGEDIYIQFVSMKDARSHFFSARGATNRSKCFSSGERTRKTIPCTEMKGNLSFLFSVCES